MLVGKKKAKSPVKKVSYVGTIVVRGRERKLYKGQKGGLFYRSKGVKVYVDKKTASREYRKKRVAAKRQHTSPGPRLEVSEAHCFVLYP